MLGATPAAALPSPDAVISEVYGGGGNSGATLTRDFIELANRGTAPVDLTGWSVQYLPATPSAASRWQVTALTGTVQPFEHYLVGEAAGSGGTVELPTPDAEGSIFMSATAATVALVRSTEALTCLTSADCAADSRIADLVGYGSAAVHETSPAPAGSNTTSLARDGFLTDIDDNSVDFRAGAPTPRNSEPPPGDSTPPTVTIATPVDGASYGQGSTVPADYACVDEAGGSGIASCSGTVPDGSAIDTATVGLQPFSVTAIDNAGNATTKRVFYRVVDVDPPTVSCSATPAVLKSNNHKAASITTAVSVTDEPGGSGAFGFTLVSVQSSQADSGLGEDDQPDDIQDWTVGTADTAGLLRTERYGGDRVYTLTYEGRDFAGNTATCQTTVTVQKGAPPHARRPG